MVFSHRISELDVSSVASIALALIGLYILKCLCVGLYNVFWHPLAKYPGPISRAAFYFPDAISNISGTNYIDTKALHDKYGGVVRIKPNGLSYKTAQAWRDVYGLKPDRTDYTKDPAFQTPGASLHIITAITQEDHARFRKVLAPAFSDRALQEQEPLLNTYFNLLVTKLKEQIDGPAKGKTDMAAYYNFATFDIMGDLAFGAPFGSLEGGEYHTFIRNLFESIKALIVVRAAALYPACQLLLRVLAKLRSSAAKRKAFVGFAKEKVHARLARKTDRKDIISHILKYNSQHEANALTTKEIEGNARILLLAGSETSATHLSGATYLLLTHPEKLQRLQSEIRSAFASIEDIDLKSLSGESSLPYLHAVIKETFRYYPSVPTSFPRLTGPEGGMIDGQFVPANTQIGVHQWSAYHSASNFAAPDEFHPERWLPDEAPEMFKNDSIAALQPFSFGPRACLGKSLAYFEIKSILTRVLWQFDMQLDPASTDWLNQKEYNLWEKSSLWVKLTHRVG